MTYALIVLVMATLARLSGGGLFASKLAAVHLKWLPAAVFGLVFGLCHYQVWTWWSLPIVFAVGAWSYIWMQTGHGSVLHWGTAPFSDAAKRKQTLTPFVNWLSFKLHIPLGTVAYCRLFMAVKGFLIGLPVGGAALAVLWPLGYEIGERLGNRALREWASGAGAGLSIGLYLWLT